MRPALLPVLLISSLLTPALPAAAGDDLYTEDRELSADATGVERLEIDVGAGFLDIRGDDEATTISVSGTLWVESSPRDPDRAARILERFVDFRLETHGDTARLVSLTEDPGLGWSLPHIDLQVVVPTRLELDIEDQSGWLRVEHIAANVTIRDGSGSITLDDVDGHVAIDDDSGPIGVSRLGGRLGIDDGSGSINADEIAGDVAIEDGSGSIAVRDVEGNVTIRDGSGSILVVGVRQNLHVLESGSGSVSFIDVDGEITVDD